MFSDSFLLDAGFLFTALWSILVAGLGIIAFARDFFPGDAKPASRLARNAASSSSVRSITERL